jgi:hypothetical protein
MEVFIGFIGGVFLLYLILDIFLKLLMYQIVKEVFSETENSNSQ